LLNLNFISTTIIDPRTLTKLYKYERKLLKGIFHRTVHVQSYIDCQIPESLNEIKKPKNIRFFFETDFWKDFGDPEKNNEYILNNHKRALSVNWTEKGITPSENEINNVSEEEFLNWEESQSLLKNSSVIIGLHPDQAVEAIVDFALEHNKPFAVIPCCTYYKEFPKRKWNGKPVKTYDELCGYLIDKDTRIKTEILGFEGKNKLIYWEGNKETQ